MAERADEGGWQLGSRAGATYLWRECDCDGWESGEAPIEPGEMHTRERVPGAPVELCYFADHSTEVITVLRIRSMDEDADA